MSRRRANKHTQAATASARPLRIAFLHPNLGIGHRHTRGGAERLVVDCASALQQAGHQVHVFTNYHDPQHCYPETRDGTLPVSVYGHTRDSICGRFHVLVAVARMLYLSLVFALWHARDYDVAFVDQVAHAVPIIRWTTRCKVLFYCHFPDALLSHPGGMLKRLYRLPVDRAEEWSAARSDLLLVNSRFTLSTVARTWHSLRTRIERGEVRVLYPSIDFQRYQPVSSITDLPPVNRPEVTLMDELMYGGAHADAGSKVHAKHARSPQLHLLVSINRFERKKNLPLAIRAFKIACEEQTQQHQLQQRDTGKGKGAGKGAGKGKGGAHSSLPASIAPPPLPLCLLLCGGYDPVNPENREHFAELRALCDELGLRTSEMVNERQEGGRVRLRWADGEEPPQRTATSSGPHGRVFFLRSFTDAQRSYLLSHCLCVLYTPSNEHFGIVPVEAQYMRRPVLACSSGGPLESVDAMGSDEEEAGQHTGFLCAPEEHEWSRALGRLVSDEERARAAKTTSASTALTPPLSSQLGANGHRNVLAKFHFSNFQRQLVQHIREMVEQQ